MNKFLVGAVVGVLSTLAIQSETGKKTVKFLKEKATDLLGVVEDKINSGTTPEEPEEPQSPTTEPPTPAA